MVRKSTTGIERGVRKVRKARTVVMILLVAVAIAIILIDRNEEPMELNIAENTAMTEDAAILIPQAQEQNSPPVQNSSPEITLPVEEIAAAIETEAGEYFAVPQKDDEATEEKADKPSPFAQVAVTEKPEENQVKPRIVQNASCEYEVQDGDSLTLISYKHYGTASHWKKIQRANNLASEDVRAGDKLFLPKIDEVKAEKITPQKHRRANRSRHSSPSPCEMVHVIRKGETLTEIAKKYEGVSFLKLYETNKSVLGQNPHFIKPGIKLHIPGTPMASMNR